MGGGLRRRIIDAARQHRHRPAVTDGAITLSYGELAEWADRCRAALAVAGVGPGDAVCWHGARSVAGVAAIHGILLAGAAYVPLDPDSPIDRCARIVAAGRPRAIVADAQARQGWPDLHWTPIAQDPSAVGPGVSGSTDLAVAVFDDAGPPPPRDTAYILHTSGSTGTPKGVVHTHDSALAFVDWAAAEVGLTADDVVVGTAPLHFDLSTFDLFGAVSVGATLALMPRSGQVFPPLYRQFIRDVGGTVIYAVPSALARAVAGPDRLDTLRVVICAGEVLRVADVETLRTAAPHARQYNFYGPTETNVCTFYALPDDPTGLAAIPIGRPTPGTEIVVVDPAGDPVPPGERGELLVRGPTMMTGYWTGEAPFRHRDGLPWYPTGDCVSVDDGDIAFFGRLDHQVKSRGYRIELGEVEHWLTADPDVAEAAVVAVPDPGAGAVLWAFVVTTAAAELVRKRLAQQVPGYMVPESIVRIDGGLPRLTNGKVDRADLAARALTARYVRREDSVDG